MLFDCFAFLCNLILLLLNLKYMAKPEKCVLFFVVNHRKKLITLPYWLVQLISSIVPSLIMTCFTKLKAQSENIGTMQSKRPINLQVYGIITNFLIVVTFLSVSIFKLSIK